MDEDSGVRPPSPVFQDLPMRIAPVLVLAGALLLPARAAAQGGTAGTPPTASHLAAARELLSAMHLEEVSAVGVKVMLDTQISATPAMEPYRAVMTEWANEIFASEEARAAFAALYASTFSEAELRQMTAFYRSPLGQRMAQNQATLAVKGAEIGRALATARQTDLMARIQRVTPAP